MIEAFGFQYHLFGISVSDPVQMNIILAGRAFQSPGIRLGASDFHVRNARCCWSFIGPGFYSGGFGCSCWEGVGCWLMKAVIQDFPKREDAEQFSKCLRITRDI